MKSLRCAGAEYLRLAAGETHFSLFTRLMPWDHVPGTLLHSEAGGLALCFDGTPYKATRWRETGLLMAPDRQRWAALHATLLAAAYAPTPPRDPSAIHTPLVPRLGPGTPWPKHGGTAHHACILATQRHGPRPRVP